MLLDQTPEPTVVVHTLISAGVVSDAMGTTAWDPAGRACDDGTAM